MEEAEDKVQVTLDSSLAQRLKQRKEKSMIHQVNDGLVKKTMIIDDCVASEILELRKTLK